MQTEIKDPQNPDSVQVLSQFAHLSIQELLAMAGLLKQSSEHIEVTVKQLCSSEQFNMALLFLYGLAFNNTNETIQKLCEKVGLTAEQRHQAHSILKEAAPVSVLIGQFKIII